MSKIENEEGVIYCDGAIMAGGRTVRAVSAENGDSVMETLSRTFMGAVAEGYADVAVTVTEHRHQPGPCQAVLGRHVAGMAECYRWSHDRAFYGI